MKKNLIVLSLLISTPLSMVVACGKKEELIKGQDNENPINNGLHFDLTSAFKIDGIEPDVKEDGIYIIPHDYKNGKVWDGGTVGSGHEYKNGMKKINENEGLGLVNSLMLGDNDSVYMIYNWNDRDGFAPDDFEKNLYFVDSSTASGLDQDNLKLGNIKASGFGEYITFEMSSNKSQGKIRPYFGSQSNHMSSITNAQTTFEKSILNLEHEIGALYPDELQKILDYYGIKIENNQVVDNPLIINHASRVFAPIFSSKPIFTVERVALNAYKITYHFDGLSRITAAHFALHSTNDANNVATQYGSLSMGDKQEWDSYISHQDAQYIGIKDIYLKNN